MNIEISPETLYFLLEKKRKCTSKLIFIDTFKLNSKAESLYVLLVDGFHASRAKPDAQSVLNKSLQNELATPHAGN